MRCQSCTRGRGRRAPPPPRPPGACGPISANLSPRSPSRPRGGRRGRGGPGSGRGRASHLDRGQGPGGCARGGCGVGGARCRHFRSSPSLLSTCCCVGPAGTGRTRQPPSRWGRAARAELRSSPPYLTRPRCAPVRRCATSLLGPLVMVYMVRRGRSAPAPSAPSPPAGPRPDLAPSDRLTLGGCRGRGPFNGRPALRGGGGPATHPRPLKGPRRGTRQGWRLGLWETGWTRGGARGWGWAAASSAHPSGPRPRSRKFPEAWAAVRHRRLREP